MKHIQLLLTLEAHFGSPIAESDNGERIYAQYSDSDPDGVNPPSVSTIWGDNRVVALLSSISAGVPNKRYYYVPAEEPLNKAQAQLAALRLLGITDTDYVIMQDADVILGERDHSSFVQQAFCVLTGGPEVVGTFKAPALALEAILKELPLYDGWGYEDVHTLYLLARELGRLPTFISARDSVAIAHPSDWRQGSSKGEGPDTCARNNKILFYESLGVQGRHPYVDALFMHAARRWRSSDETV